MGACSVLSTLHSIIFHLCMKLYPRSREAGMKNKMIQPTKSMLLGLMLCCLLGKGKCPTLTEGMDPTHKVCVPPRQVLL